MQAHSRQLEAVRRQHPDFITEDSHIEPDFVFCTACDDEDADDNNDIIHCDLCNTPVHYQCYGDELLDFDSTKVWYCAACVMLIKDPNQQTPACALCPQTNMILKRVELRSEGKRRLEWVHASCLKYFPKVARESYYDTGRYRKADHECDICQLEEGYVRRCSFKKCRVWFHIGCAKTKGMIVGKKGMEAIRYHLRKETNDSTKTAIYCNEHVNEFIHDIGKQSGQKAVTALKEETVNITYDRQTQWYKYNKRGRSRQNSPQKRVVEQVQCQTTPVKQSKNQQVELEQRKPSTQMDEEKQSKSTQIVDRRVQEIAKQRKPDECKSDPDLVERIQNIVIIPRDLHKSVPTFKEAFSKEYLSKIKEEQQAQLRSMRKEFKSQNNAATSKGNYFLDFNICMEVFRKYYVIHSLTALENYLLGYLWINGLLDIECKLVRFNCRNPASAFWEQKAKEIGTDGKLAVAWFIKVLLDTYVTTK